MNAQPHCQTEGERRKLDALETLESQREVYVNRARRALLQAILCYGSATIDEVRDCVELPSSIGPKLFGAVPKALVKAGIIRADGFAKTCRPAAHARNVTVWTIADGAAAEQWLADHPDLPAPGDDDHDAGSQGLLFQIHPTNESDPGDCRRRGRSG